MKNLTSFIALSFLILSVTNLYSGTYSGGSGISTDPWQISNIDDLIELSNTPGDWGDLINNIAYKKYFIQTADIIFDADESQVDWDGDGTATWDAEDQKGFSPIGNGNDRFIGEYNGQGYKIQNLFINRPGTKRIGLFGLNLQSFISNLGVTDASVTGDEMVGALIGRNYSYSTISKCYATGNVTGDRNVGGLAGFNSYDSEISGCFANCTVNGNEYSAGVFIGYNHMRSTISNCYSMGDVTRKSGSTSVQYGGFCGFNEGGCIQYCYTTGSVYYSGAADPDDKGFLGVENWTTNSYTSNFFDSEASNQLTDAVGAATPKTTIEMKTQSTFTGWDFTSIWAISPTINDGYPYLQWQTFPPSLPTLTTTTISSITSTSAASGGNISDDGGAPVTARGVCWNTSGNPTIADTRTIDGSGTGSFTSNLVNLDPDTKYYVMAYATNSAGTAYGQQEEFTTDKDNQGPTTYGTYYVDQNNGNDSWDGLNPTHTGGNNGPKATIQAACDAASDGDAVELVPGSGPYSGIVLNLSGKNIMFDCNVEEFTSASPVITINSGFQFTFINSVFNDLTGSEDFFQIDGSGNVICYNCTFITNGTTLTDCAAIKAKVSGSGSGKLFFNDPQCAPGLGNLVLWLDPTNVGNTDGQPLGLWEDQTATGADASISDDKRKPAYTYDAINKFPGVTYSTAYGDTEYGLSDILAADYFKEVTTSTTDRWAPDNSARTLFLVFKTGTDINDGGTTPYYSDGRQTLFEAGGPLSGYNMFIANGRLCFGMWNRFEKKYIVYDPPDWNDDLYPLNTESVYVAQLEYDGTDFRVFISKDGGSQLVGSGKISFQGLTKDGKDKTGIGGAARTSYHDYNTGETYSDHFDGTLGDVMLYDIAFDQSGGQAVYDFLADRYSLTPFTYPAPKISPDDWRVYEFKDINEGVISISEAWPNPFSVSSNVAVNISQATKVKVELLDAAGHIVETIINGSLAKGMHEFTIDGANLAEGMYLFRITGEGFVRSGKVICIK